MGRLVGVARVRGVVVHVGGRWWAVLPGPSYAPATATFLPNRAQLAFAIADRLGGDSQREAQQVHFTPEGIYLASLRRMTNEQKRSKGENGLLSRAASKCTNKKEKRQHCQSTGGV